METSRVPRQATYWTSENEMADLVKVGTVNVMADLREVGFTSYTAEL